MRCSAGDEMPVQWIGSFSVQFPEEGGWEELSKVFQDLDLTIERCRMNERETWLVLQDPLKALTKVTPRPP